LSEKRTEVTPALEGFLAPYWDAADPLLVQIRDDIHKREKNPMQISMEQVAFHAWLCRLIGAKRVLEVGTYLGLSAAGFALAMADDGRVDTVEVLDEHADIAEEWFARGGLSGKITVHRGAALEIVPTLAGPYDLCFLDGHKPDNEPLMKLCIERTRPGALILVDNVFNDGYVADLDNQGADGARAALEFGRTSPDLDSVVVPVADGILIGRRV
jgi:predicted O-methyltransferase YrrM